MTNNELNRAFARVTKKERQHLNRLARGYEAELTQLYKEGLRNVRALIGEVYAKYGPGVTLDDLKKLKLTRKVRNDIMRVSRYEILERDIIKEMQRLNAQTRALTGRALKESYAEQYYYTGFKHEKVLGRALGFGGLDQNVISLAIINPADAVKWPDLLKGHITELEQSVRRAVALGLKQGVAYEASAIDYVDRMRETIGDKFTITRNRAKRIIRTESQRVKSEARNVAFNKSQRAADKLGLTIQHIWDAVKGDPSVHRHGDINGVAADENGEWTLPNTGATTTGPGLSGDPGEDVNCMCNTRTEVVELEKGVKAESTNEDYDDWRERKELGVVPKPRARKVAA